MTPRPPDHRFTTWLRAGMNAFGVTVRHVVIWVVEALVLMWMAERFPGAYADTFLDAFVVVLVLATTNVLLTPLLLRFATRFPAWVFPILTFALNGVVLYLLDGVIPGWNMEYIWWAAIFALVLTIVSTLLGSTLALNDEGAWRRFALGPMRARYAAQGKRADTTPGFIFLEIDGLAGAVLEYAIERKYVPNMAAWIADGSHVLRTWECDLSSQTSASQAGILLGNNENIPAFRWYDRTRGRVVVSNHFRDTAMLEERQSIRDGLLIAHGASRGNMFSGDAADSLLTYSRIRAEQGDSIAYWLFYTNAYNLARTLALFLTDIGKEIVARLWQRMRNELPRVHRGGVYPIARAGCTSFLREFSTFTVAGDMMRGVPSVYTMYLAYDEVAHHSGIMRGDTMRVLREVDRDIGRLARLAKEVDRPYHLVVLSDHGQVQGETFLQRYGESLEQVVEGALVRDPSPIAPGLVMGGQTVDEGWDSIGALLTEVLARDSKAAPVVRRVFRKQLTDGAVDLGDPQRDLPMEREPESAGVAPPQVVVLASGCLGLITFTESDRPLSLEAIEARTTTLVPTLIRHPGVGFVAVVTEANGPVALGKAGFHVLADGRVEGEDPLAGYGPNAARHLRRALAFTDAPDIYVHAVIDHERGEIPAFEELVGSHGGMGGSQEHPFILVPTSLDPGAEMVVGAEALHRLFKTWIADAQGVPGPIARQTEQEQADASAA
ncbi:MAG: phage holin family protein [Thermomicrobiales bacterium]